MGVVAQVMAGLQPRVPARQAGRVLGDAVGVGEPVDTVLAGIRSAPSASARVTSSELCPSGSGVPSHNTKSSTVMATWTLLSEALASHGEVPLLTMWRSG